MREVENVGKENEAQDCMGEKFGKEKCSTRSEGWKIWEKKMRDTAASVSFAEVENSMYKRRRTAMPTLPMTSDQSHMAVSSSRFAVLGQSAFCRGQVSSGADSSALLFASDEQLELLRPAALLIHVDATFRVVL